MTCIKKLQKVLQVWGMRFLALYGKIIIFKSLAFSKIIYIASMATVPADVIKIIENIHKNFVWDKKHPNIKHLSLIRSYSCGGLNDIDITSKFKSLHLNWLNRLFDSNFHPWKQIPLYYLKRVSKKFNLFHPNLSVPSDMLSTIPMFYRNIIDCWQDLSFISPTNAAMIFFESLDSIHSLKFETLLFVRHFLMILTRSTYIICLRIMEISYPGPMHPENSSCTIILSGFKL